MWRQSRIDAGHHTLPAVGFGTTKRLNDSRIDLDGVGFVHIRQCLAGIMPNLPNPGLLWATSRQHFVASIPGAVPQITAISFRCHATSLATVNRQV
jgi:hypothetical protein